MKKKISDEAAAWDEHYSINLVEQDFGTLVTKNDLSQMYVRQVFEACNEGDATLEFGCGKGTMSALLAMHKKAKPTLVDFSPNALAYAKLLFKKAGVKGKFYLSDFTRMPMIKAESFDLVFGKGVLEHVPGYMTGARKGMKELVRVLKPGGRIVFTVPNSWRPDGNWFHVRSLKIKYTQYEFSVKQMVDLCEEFGLVVDGKFGDGCFYLTPGEFLRLTKLDKLFGKNLPIVENQELRQKERQSSNPGLAWKLNKAYFYYLNKLNKRVILPAEFSLMFGLRARKPERVSRQPH